MLAARLVQDSCSIFLWTRSTSRPTARTGQSQGNRQTRPTQFNKSSTPSPPRAQVPPHRTRGQADAADDGDTPRRRSCWRERLALGPESRRIRTALNLLPHLRAVDTAKTFRHNNGCKNAVDTLRSARQAMRFWILAARFGKELFMRT